MKTLVFKNYQEFLKREDKSVNGVSSDFAERHPDYKYQNNTNKGCWNCSRCSDCSDCSDCSGCYDCSNCSDCSGCYDCYRCYGCSNCSGCYDCSNCSGCYDCYRCYRCYDLKNENKKIEVPVIFNIHNEVLKAINTEGCQLDTDKCHICDTTHCRAGWVVHLAGEKGYELEKQTSAEFAAKQIYKASSEIKVSPTMFFVDNETARKDIIRCAELEEQL